MSSSAFWTRTSPPSIVTGPISRRERLRVCTYGPKVRSQGSGSSFGRKEPTRSSTGSSAVARPSGAGRSRLAIGSSGLDRRGEPRLADVTGWPVADVAERLRGPAGTPVRLRILPAGDRRGGADDHADPRRGRSRGSRGNRTAPRYRGIELPRTENRGCQCAVVLLRAGGWTEALRCEW